MTAQSYSARELFRLVTRPPVAGNPSWLDLSIHRLSAGNPSHLRGPGLYACFLDGKLFYIGKYRGRGSNPFTGNVASTRWDKHLGTFTMRGRKVSVSPGNLAAACALASTAFAEDLRQADPDALARDRGMQTSLKRVQFAAHYWESFATFDETALDRFAFLYAQVDRDLGAGLSIQEVRSAVSAAEVGVISALQPFGNSETTTGLPLADIGPDQVGPLLTAALHNQLCKPSIVQAPTSESTDRSPSLGASEDDQLTPRILTLVDDHGEQLIAVLQTRIEADAPELEVYFTAAAGGDLRVRHNPLVGKPRTVLTMQWKQSSRSLQCQSPLTLEQCVAAGFDQKRVHLSTDAVMKSLIELGTSGEQTGALFALILTAQKQVTAKIKAS